MEPKFKPPERNRKKVARFDVLLRKLKRELPSFTGCKRCGECCGPLKLHKKEWDKIYSYIKENNLLGAVVMNYEAHKIFQEKTNIPSCFFLTIQEDGLSSCLIYKVRPIVCRMQGMKIELQCKHSPNENIPMTRRMNDYYDEVKNNGLILNKMIERLVLFYYSTKQSMIKAREKDEL